MQNSSYSENAAIKNLQEELDPILWNVQNSILDFAHNAYRDELLSATIEIRDLIEKFQSTKVRCESCPVPFADQSVNNSEDQSCAGDFQKWDAQRPERVTALNVVTPVQSNDPAEGTGTPPSRVRRSTFGGIVAQWEGRYRSVSLVKSDGHPSLYNPSAQCVDDDFPLEFYNFQPANDPLEEQDEAKKTEDGLNEGAFPVVTAEFEAYMETEESLAAYDAAMASRERGVDVVKPNNDSKNGPFLTNVMELEYEKPACDLSNYLHPNAIEEPKVQSNNEDTAFKDSTRLRQGYEKEIETNIEEHNPPLRISSNAMKDMRAYMRPKHFPSLKKVSESDEIPNANDDEKYAHLDTSTQMQKSVRCEISEVGRSSCIPHSEKRRIASKRKKSEVHAAKKATVAHEKEEKRHAKRKERKEQTSQLKNASKHKLHIPIKIASKPDVMESERSPELSPNKKRKTEAKRKQKKTTQARLKNSQRTTDPQSMAKDCLPETYPESFPQNELASTVEVTNNTKPYRGERQNNKRIPSWTMGIAPEQDTIRNKHLDRQSIFPRLTTIDPRKVFGTPSPTVVRDVVRRAYAFDRQGDSCSGDGNE